MAMYANVDGASKLLAQTSAEAGGGDNIYNTHQKRKRHSFA